MPEPYNRNRSSFRDRIREKREERLEKLERDARRINKAAKIFFFLLLVAYFVITHKKTAKADGSILEKINVKVEQNYGEPGEILEPTVTVSTGNVSVGEIDYSKKLDKWRPGNKILITIDLHADEGYYFAKNWNRSAVALNGAEFSHCGRVDDGDILRLKVYYMPCTVLESTASAGWDYNFKKAVWKEVEYAPGYEVTLYENDKSILTKKVRGTSLDLSDKIPEYTKDTYYYEVKAIAMTSDEKKYLKDGEAVTSEEDVVNSHTGTKGVTPIGYNTTTSEGTATVYNSAKGSTTGWYYPGGAWFYYDDYGRAATGWQLIGDSWYYFDNKGQMMTGFLVDGDGSTYYLDPTYGRMHTGWVFINGFWYYFNSSGRMQTGYLYDGGKVYYLDDYGRMMAQQ